MKKTLIIALLFTFLASGKAEMYFILPLDKLIKESSIILKTEFQCRYGNSYLFTTDTSDSIYIDQSQMLYFYNSPAKKYYNYIKEEDPCNLYDGIWQSDFCYLFIENMDHNNIVKLVPSGIKITKGKELYSQKYHRPSNFFSIDSPHNLNQLLCIETDDLSLIIKSW